MIFKYSLFSLILPEFTPAQAARMIKDAGYDGVEWRCTVQPADLPTVPNPWSSNRTTLDVNQWKTAVVEHRKITQDHGLECPNLATYCRADQPDAVRRSIEIAKELGAPRFRIWAPLYNGTTPYPELYAKARDQFALISTWCQEAGVQGLLELHMGCIAPSSALALRLIEGADPRYLGVIYDPANMVIEGSENWKMGSELLGPYLAFCHAKNSRLRVCGTTESGAVKWVYEPCEMNSGFVDWMEVFRAFRSVGYNGWISNEDHFMAQGTSMDRIKFGLQHLKRCEQVL